jgi:hypothetical protein
MVRVDCVDGTVTEAKSSISVTEKLGDDVEDLASWTVDSLRKLSSGG